MVMPVNQKCPRCGRWFMGSDCIGRPCGECETPSDVATAIERPFRRRDTIAVFELPRWCSEVGVTANVLDNVCMSFRHDFGLLSQEDKDKTRFAAVEWIRALLKHWESPDAVRYRNLMRDVADTLTKATVQGVA